MEVEESGPRLRAAVLVVVGGKILVVRHRKNGREYYMLPGGGVRRGEKVPEALAREVEEETGLRITPGRLLFVTETLFPGGGRHIVHLVFSVRDVQGTLGKPRDARVKSAEWVDVGGISGMEILPPMGDFLRRAAEGEEEYGVYIPPRWKDLEDRPEERRT